MITYPNPTPYPTREQNDVHNPILIFLKSTTDHATAVTGVTPTVKLIKTSGVLSVPAGQVTEIGSGGYKITFAATDLDTPGDMIVYATATGADPISDRYTILPAAGVNRTDWTFNNDTGPDNVKPGYVYEQQSSRNGGTGNR